LDLAFRDGDLVRLTAPALDLVFALLLVFAAALAFADFVFFLATMCAPSAPNDNQPCRVATPTTNPQPRSKDSRKLAIGLYSQGLYPTLNDSETLWRRRRYALAGAGPPRALHDRQEHLPKSAGTD